MPDVLDDLGVTGRRLGVVGAGSERRRGCEAGPLLSHPFHLALLRLGELRCDDDQAEVDHEEGTDLSTEGPEVLLQRWISTVGKDRTAYHYQQHKVDPIPEAVCVLHVVHYIRPTFERYDLEKEQKLC